jgi:insecticidal toxin complex protein TccC
LQRWINPDPAGDEDGPNRYKMVSNNPINLIDRFGLQGEQSFVSGLLAASALASLLVAGGFGLGSLADYGDEGAMVGAAVGAAVLALFLGTVVEEWWLAYQQSRPEVIAAEEQEFLKALKAQHRETADEYGLTEDEGVRFSNFVLEQIQSHGDIHTSFALHETDAGHIFAYVGPSTTAGQAVDALSSTKPGNKLNDLGHKTLLVRSAPGAHSSPALGGTITGQFESENFVSVAGQPKGGGTSQPGPGVIQPHSAGPAPAQKMVIDTEALSGILKNVSDSDRRVVESAIDKLLDGRLPANHWKRYGNKMFAVDLPGYGGGKRRGTHRLMFSRQENSRYKVEEIRKTH